MVTVDAHKGTLNGEQEDILDRYLALLKTWQKDNTKTLTIYLHSATPSRINGYLKYPRHDDLEIMDLGSFYAGSTSFSSFLGFTLNTNLNKLWDLGLPKTKEEARALLPAHWDDLNQENLTIEQLRQLDLRSLAFSLDPDVSIPDSLSPLSFEYGTNGVVTGYAAFTQLDVQSLREQGKAPILIINSLDLRTKSWALAETGIAGIVVAEEAAGHDRLVFEAFGIKGLFGGDLPQEVSYGDEVSCSEKKFYHGHIDILPPEITEKHRSVAQFADDFCCENNGLLVYGNADTTDQLTIALDSGVDAIGLMRTEHMFFDDANILANLLKEAIDDSIQRISDQTLQDFKQKQQEKFKQLIEVAQNHGDPLLRVRLLDAPLDEFLSAEDLGDTNILDYRGCLLGEKYPETYEAQAAALFAAVQETGYNGPVEIMIPFVGNQKQAQFFKNLVFSQKPVDFKGTMGYGCMIETTEGVDNIRLIAPLCDFASVGTNDFTSDIIQVPRSSLKDTMQWILSQGLPETHNPYQSFIPQVSGAITSIVTDIHDLGLNIPVSVCGGQVSGDYLSIQACQQAGVQSISVSPQVSVIIASKIMAGKVLARQQHEEMISLHGEKGMPSR